MRKLLWGCALAALGVGIYWSVAHATVHPESPVGRYLAWLGVEQKVTPARAAQPVFAAVELKPGSGGSCCRSSDPEPIFVRAEKPAGLIAIQPDFPLMTDPDGNEVVVPYITGASSEPVREVALTGEEFRIMPEVCDEELVGPACPAEVAAARKKCEITVGLHLCPLQAICSIKFGDCCQVLTLPGLYHYVCGKVCGADCCPCVTARKPAAPVVVKGIEACPHTCPGACPVKTPERIIEPPVEVEESETRTKSSPEPIAEPPVEVEKGKSVPRTMSLQPYRRNPVVDTMEMRPGDAGLPQLAVGPF